MTFPLLGFLRFCAALCLLCMKLCQHRGFPHIVRSSLCNAACVVHRLARLIRHFGFGCISLRRVAQRQSTVGLNSPAIFICCSFCGSKQSFPKSLLHITPGFPASCSFSTNKTFEGQLKPSKPFSYRRFSWLTLCGCQVRNKNFCKKISPTRLSIGSYTNLSLVGLIFLFIIRGLNLTTDDIIPAYTNRLN